MKLNIACQNWLISWPWDKEYNHLVLTLLQSPQFSLDVDERPPPIVKLADAQHHAQLLATFFFMDNPLEFTPTNVMKLHAISEILLNKIYIAKF